MKKSDVTVVICSAGMGTRLGIGTTKALIDICGKPLIIRQLELLDGYDDVRIVLGYQAEKVIEVVNNHRKDVMFAFNYDYQNTGAAASLSKGIINSRKYIVSIDGDLLINPNDFDKFINYDGECIAISKNVSDEPVNVKIEHNRAISFCKTSDYEWSGMVKVKRDSLKFQKGHIYEMLTDALPMDVMNIETRDIDTQDDYERTVKWVKNGYKK